MKIVVIGGSGLIGTKLVNRLREKGHEVVAASPNSGVNTITGEGLAEALAGAQVVVDVANSPSFEDKAVLEFFETSGRNLLAAEAAAGVGHHVALSVVGTDRLPESGYFRAKMAQEKLIKASGIPYTIVRSTQFFEFVDAHRPIGHRRADVIRLSPALVQPIASDDVAAALADARARGAGERHGRDRRSRAHVLSTSSSRQFLAANERPAPGDRRRPRALLRHRAERSIADARRQPAPRRDALRGLAQPRIVETARSSRPRKPATIRRTTGSAISPPFTCTTETTDDQAFLCAAALTAVCIGAASAQDASGDKTKVTLVYDQVLPNVPGKSIRGVLVEYEPGGFSPAHTHPSLRLHLRNGAGGGDPKPGQRWPGDHLSRRRKLVRASRRPSSREREREHHGARAPARRLRRRHERDRDHLSAERISTAPRNCPRRCPPARTLFPYSANATRSSSSGGKAWWIRCRLTRSLPLHSCN